MSVGEGAVAADSCGSSCWLRVRETQREIEKGRGRG